MHFYKVTQSWHFLCVHSGTYWSQTYQPLWPLGSCVRRWEQCAALPSSSPSHSSGLMMKVDVPCCKILHPQSVCPVLHAVAFSHKLLNSGSFPGLLANQKLITATSHFTLELHGALWTLAVTEHCYYSAWVTVLDCLSSCLILVSVIYQEHPESNNCKQYAGYMVK